MLLIRRRISFILLIVTLLSLLPRGSAAAMPGTLPTSPAEATLAPLAPAAAPVRPADAHSTLALASTPLIGPTSTTAAPSTRKKVLFYGPSMTGSVAQTFSWMAPVVWDAGQWTDATTDEFAQFDAIVIGNFNSEFQECNETSSILATAIATKDRWSPAVTGNIVVTGSDLESHTVINLPENGYARQLLNQALKYVAAGSVNGPGLYVDYSCVVFNTTPVNVDLLSGFGAFTTVMAHRDMVHRQQATHPMLDGLGDQDLSNWHDSVHAAFPQYPTSFTALMYGDPVLPQELPYSHILVRGAQADPVVPLPDDYGVGDCDCQKSGDPTVQTGDPVDSRTLSYVRTATDMTVPSAGPPLAFSRTYISMFADPTKYPVGSLGPGWRHRYEEQLTFAGAIGGEPDTIIVEDPTGTRLRFDTAYPTTETGPGGVTRTVYPASRGIYAKLTKDAGSTNYVLTSRDQSLQIFNAAGKLIEQRDPQGRRQILSYYDVTGQLEYGQLKEVKDLATARTLTFTYNRDTFANGQPTRVYLAMVKNQLNQSVTFSYYNTGTLLTPLYTVVTTSITRWTYSYEDGTGVGYLMTGVYPGSSQSVAAEILNVYVNGRISMQGDAAGMLTTYTQSTTAAGTTTTVKTTNGSGSEVYDTLQYVYRPDGTLAQVIQDNQDQGTITFDADTLVPSQQADANGHGATITNNAVGQPTRIVDAAGAATDVSYNSQNLPTSITGADGVRTVITYDTATNRNPVTVVRRPVASSNLSLTTNYTYTPYAAPDPRANRVETVEADGVVTKFTYDTLGQVTDVTTGFGLGGTLETTTHTVYDVLGRPTDVTAAYGTTLATTTHTDYNQHHQVTKVTRNYQGTGVYSALYPDRNVWTEYGYDGQGRRRWTKEVDGHFSDYTFYTSTGTVGWTVQNPVNSTGVPTLPTTSTPPAFSPARPDANVATTYEYNQQRLMTLSTQTGILTGTFNTSTRQFSGATTIATRIEYDGLNRPVTTTLNYRPGESVTAERNIQTYTYYDAAGNVTWQSDELGRWNKTEYDALDRVQRSIQNYQDGENNGLDLHADTDLITVNQYNPLGQLEFVTENYIDGQTQFDTINGAVIITEESNDRVTRYGYDLLGRRTTTTSNYLNQANVSNGNYTTQVAYQPTTGRVLATSDLLDQWDAPVYDELGRTPSTIRNCRTAAGAVVNTGSTACAALTTTRPDRNVPTPTATYDALGRVFRTTDVLAVMTDTRFDGLSRPIEVIRNYKYGITPTADVNVKTTTTYLNGAATVWKVTDPTGRVTSYQANALGQTITITDSANLVTRMGHDSTGERWRLTPAGVFTVTRVDNLGRPITTIENYENGTVDATDGTTRDLTTSTKLDAGGRVVETTNPAGEVTRFSYDLRDQLVQVIEGVKAVCPTYALANADCNLVTQYTYDWGGNQTSSTNARGYGRYKGYGTRGEVLWDRNETTTTENLRYDRAGRLIQTAINDTFFVNTYGYDELSRQTSRNGQSWVYDAAGRTLSFTDPAAASTTYAKTGALSYGYDKLNRVIQTQSSLDGDPASGLTTTPYAYDAAGRVINVGGMVYNYDTFGRPSLIKQGKTIIGEQTYDSSGRPTVFTRYDNGVAVTTSTTSYDAAQRVQGIQSVKMSTNVILADFTATYDRANRVTTAMQRTTSSAGATVTANLSYAYDLVGRLMTEVQGSTTTDYRYDAAGNRTLVRVNGATTQSRSYTAANQVVGWGYDQGGRLTSDGTSTYGYDAFDRLTSITQGGTTTTMAYHGESLVAKYVGGVRTFGYEHNTVTGANSTLLRIHDFQTAGVTANTTYAYTRNGQGFWSEQSTNGALSQIFLFGDQLGTVRQTYNPDAAAPNRQDTDVWGRPTGTQVSALRFAGEYQDAQSGLVFLRARWYNPTNGTFQTRDPFGGRSGQPATQHPYQYSWNAPTVYTDPSGRDPWPNDHKDITLSCTERWREFTDEYKACKETEAAQQEARYKRNRSVPDTSTPYVPTLEEVLSNACTVGGMTPGVETAVDWAQALSKQECGLGRELSWLEWGISVGCAILPGIGAKWFTGPAHAADKGADVAGGVARGAAHGAGKAVVELIGKSYDKIGTVIERGIGVGKLPTLIDPHAIERMAERGLSIDNITDWSKLDTVVLSQADGAKFLNVTGAGAWVVDAEGTLVTVYDSARFKGDSLLQLLKDMGLDL